MSYDVYLWHRAVGAIDEVLDDIAEEDPSRLVPDPSVRTFRDQLVHRFPQLASVIGPDETSGAAESFVSLTLPYGWLDLLAPILDLAADNRLTGWDPQVGEPVGRPSSTQTHAPRAPGSVRRTDGWTVERLTGIGISGRWVSQAWALAELPERVSFGEAVGAFIMAMAMRDGVLLEREHARRTVEFVARHCADGPPAGPVVVHIGHTITDVTGFAHAVMQGKF